MTQRIPGSVARAMRDTLPSFPSVPPDVMARYARVRRPAATVPPSADVVKADVLADSIDAVESHFTKVDVAAIVEQNNRLQERVSALADRLAVAGVTIAGLQRGATNEQRFGYEGSD